MLKTEYPPAPLLLGFILGPLMEEHAKRALQISRGDFMVFLERPISATFLVASALILLLLMRPVATGVLARLKSRS